MNHELAPSKPEPLALQRFLPFVIAAFLGLAFAVLLPSFSGPDERGHLAYVSALSSGHLPIFPATETADIERGITWQAQHPPLFYLFATPFYKVATWFAPQSGLFAVRLLGVLCFVLTVLVAQKIAECFMSKKAAWLAAMLVATHPVVSYVMSMANNESLAILLSSLCVLSALLANPPKSETLPHETISFETLALETSPLKWNSSGRLTLCILCCGLALWTKLTTIAGVMAAVYIVGLSRESESSWNTFQWRRALLVLCGAVLLWLPWALLMKFSHGKFFPSVAYVPGLEGGPIAIFLFPGDVLKTALANYWEFTAGLFTPFWLLRTYVSGWLMQVGSALFTLWILWTAKKQPWSRFALIGFFMLYLLALNTVLFHFNMTALFVARYTGAATVLFCVVAAQQLAGQIRTHRVLVLGVWSLIAFCNFAFVFWFFLVRR